MPMLLALLVEIPQYGSVNLVEALWLTFGVVGIFYVLRNFADVLGQMRDLIFVPEGTPDREKQAMAIAAWGHVRRDALRSVQMLCVVGIGITAVFTRPPGNGAQVPAMLTWTGLILTIALFIIVFVDIVQSFQDRKQRSDIEKIFLNGHSTPTRGGGES